MTSSFYVSSRGRNRRPNPDSFIDSLKACEVEQKICGLGWLFKPFLESSQTLPSLQCGEGNANRMFALLALREISQKAIPIHLGQPGEPEGDFRGDRHWEVGVNQLGRIISMHLDYTRTHFGIEVLDAAAEVLMGAHRSIQDLLDGAAQRPERATRFERRILETVDMVLKQADSESLNYFLRLLSSPVFKAKVCILLLGVDYELDIWEGGKHSLNSGNLWETLALMYPERWDPEATPEEVFPFAQLTGGRRDIVLKHLYLAWLSVARSSGGDESGPFSVHDGELRLIELFGNGWKGNKFLEESIGLHDLLEVEHLI